MFNRNYWLDDSNFEIIGVYYMNWTNNACFISFDLILGQSNCNFISFQKYKLFLTSQPYSLIILIISNKNVFMWNLMI